MYGKQSNTQPSRTEAPVPADSSSGRAAPLVRASLEQAITWVDAHAGRLGPEEVGLDDAVGRVAAAGIQAPSPIPPSGCASTDGYALRAAHTQGASDYNPLTFELCGPGDVLPTAAASPMVAGAALPRGADAVLPLHLAHPNGAQIEVFGPVPEGWGILREGQQLPAGATVVKAGRVLLPHHIGLLGLAGIRRMQVVRRPLVRLVVFPPKSGAPSADANTPMLRSLIERDGGAVLESAVVEPTQSASDRGQTSPLLPNEGRSGAPPQEDFFAEALSRALASPHADLMLIAGRSGHGVDDVGLRMLSEHGELAIHGVALRPGGSASLGLLSTTPALLLPGDPLECWSAYEMLAGRFIRHMAGRSPEFPYTMQQALVGHKIVSAIGVVDLCRVRLGQPSNDEKTLEPVGPAESGGITSLARADGFVIVPAPLEGFAPGTRVNLFVFDPSAPVAGEQSARTMDQS